MYQFIKPFENLKALVRSHLPLSIGITAVVAVLCVSGGILLANHPEPAAAKHVESQTSGTDPGNVATFDLSSPTTDPHPHFTDGTYVVGQDIQPGTYRTRVAPTSSCYYARLNSLNTGDILANDNTYAPAVITIGAGDKAFISRGCGTWTQDLSAITTSKTTFSDGIYIVGTDIEPGTYKSTGQTGCYWSRVRDLSGGGNNIIDNDNTNTPATVTILASDAGFEAKHCGTWTLAQ